MSNTFLFFVQSVTTLAGTFLGYLTLVFLGVVAIIGAAIGWRVSELFIPPRDHWAKSYMAVLSVKAGIALTGAYFAVMGASYVVSRLFG
jgi:hypothetical protein